MHWFGIKKTIKIGIKSLWMHRLRSTLTTLGVVFGVCSVIAMLAIGEGANRETQRAIAQLGSTNIIIETVKPPEEQADSGSEQSISNYGLTYKDAESIRHTIPDIQVTVPIRQIDHEARYLNRRTAIRIIGTIPWYTEIAPVRLLRGRFLSSIDLNHQSNVCAVDIEVARELFAFHDPIGKDIKIKGNYYRVVGLVESSTLNVGKAGSAGQGTAAPGSGGVAGNIYIPLTTTKSRFSEFSFSLSGGNRNAEKVELHKIIVKIDTIEQVLAVKDILDTLLARLHEKDDYKIVVPLELLRVAEKRKKIYSVVLGSIAAISLLVGGIGIMNIMLANVSERTREIGIRRALGAKKRDIIIQFLTETVILTLLGGVLGIVLGSIIPFLVTHFAGMLTVVTIESLILSFGISGTIGVTFGLYPAYRAANMDPIESLRHE